MSSWEALETLCAQHIQQDPRLHICSPVLTLQALTSRVYHKISSAFERKVLHSTPQVLSVPAKCSSELAAPGTLPVQEGVLTGSQAHSVANKTAARSSSTAPNARQIRLLPGANGNSAPNPLREKPREPEFVANIEDLYHEKLMVWSSDVGEAWFYPKEGFHLSNVRAATTANGPTGRVTIALAYGDSQHLEADGCAPNVQPPRQEIPSSEEDEDPPGKVDCADFH